MVGAVISRHRPSGTVHPAPSIRHRLCGGANAAQLRSHEFHVKRSASGGKEQQTAMDKSVTTTGDRPTPQQRATAIASLIQQAQVVCRADLDNISDPRARELF